MPNLMLRDALNWLPTLHGRLDQMFESPIVFDAGLLNTGGGPAVNVYETMDEYVFMAELPGWSRNQVSINCENQTLTLSGQRNLPEEDDRRYHRVEGFFGQFERSFTIPGVVDFGSIQAELTDGVLTIHLPKREEAKPKQIDIKAVQ